MARRRRPGRSRRAHRPRWWTVGVLVLVSITLITLSERGSLGGSLGGVQRGAHDAIAPIQRGVDDAVRPVADAVSAMVHYGSLEQQNAALRRQLRQLQGRAQEQAAAKDALSQLSALQKVADLPGVSQTPTVTAQVIGRASSDFADTIDLSKGTADGVDVGMPVVSGAGLVGLVIQAWSSGCTVRLLTDTASAVAVQFGSGASAGTGVVTGKGPGAPFEVDLIPPGVPLQKGLLLATSGLQHARFPAGIPVATVTSFSASASATQQTVSAKPVATMGDLQYVDVLQWQPPPLPPTGS